MGAINGRRDATTIQDYAAIIRSQIPIRDAYRRYTGREPTRDGFGHCLFHQEKTPSMKLYHDGYHCYGCGASGDTLDMAARALEMGLRDAIAALDTDYGLGLGLGRRPTLRQTTAIAKARQDRADRMARERKREDAHEGYLRLLDEVLGLERILANRAPAHPGEDWDELYCYALRHIDQRRQELNDAEDGRCIEPWKGRKYVI